jgi:hypothetical protein
MMSPSGAMLRRLATCLLLGATACGSQTWSTPPDAADAAYEAPPDETPIIDVSPERCDFTGAGRDNPVSCTVVIQDLGDDVLMIESVALASPTADCAIDSCPAPGTPVYPLETVVEVSVRCFPVGVLAPNALVIRSSDPARPVVEVPFDS